MQIKILVVDDEKPICDVLRKALTIRDYDVRCAGSAEEALSILEHESFQVYLLDMNLPEMNGIELFKQIKEDRSVAFFFAITGYTSIFDLVRCRQAGFDNYFAKPFNLELIVREIDHAFENIERWRGSQNQLRKLFRDSSEESTTES